MAQSTVRLIVDAQNAIVPLQRVNKQTQLLTNNTNKLKGRLDKSSRSLKDTGKSAKVAAAGFGTLTKSIAPLLKALAVIGTAKFILFQTAQLETQTKALEVLTGSAEKAQKIVQEIKEFGAVTPFKSSELIEVAKRMKAFGFETEQVVDITKRIADIAGTAGADINSVALAIGKVQAKNKFMQEENIMLLERGINVTKVLEEITGMNGETLAKAMSKGEIGADLFVQAIIKATSKNGEFFEGASKQSDTLAGKFSTFVDNVETFAQNLGKIFEPAIKFILDSLNTIMSEFNKMFNLLTDVNIGASNQFVGKASFSARIGAQSEAVDLITKAVETLDPSFVKTEEDAAKLFAQLDRISKVMKLVQGPDSPKVLEARGLLGPLLEAQSQMDDIRQKVEAQLKAQKLIKDEVKNTNIELKENRKIEKDINDENLDQIKAKAKLIDQLSNERALAQAALDGNLEQVKIQQQINALVAIHGEGMRDIITSYITGTEELKKQKDEADKLKEKFAEIGREIEGSIKSNLRDAITGAQSFGQAMGNVLNRIKNKLIDTQIDRLLSGFGDNFKKSGGKGLGGFLGKVFGGLFASGGQPPVNKISVVGEKGPELFVPRSAGTIIPNKNIGAGTTNIVTVNVDASGSAVSGSNQDANLLGQVIATAVQSQLVKEKRAGGLLSR